MMDSFFEFANKTQGRDKLYRTAQYASKLIGWSLKENEGNPEIIKKLAKLESHASTTRKFFRLGKSLESLRSAQKSIHLLDPVLRITLTVTHLNRAAFLLVDHYLWLGRIGMVKVTERWQIISARFYLATILLSLIRDLYALYIALERMKHSERIDKSTRLRHQILLRCCLKNPEATLDLIKNFCDFPIPGAKLGFFPNHNGLVGLLGLISSLIGAYQVAYPHMKLRP